MKKYVTVKMEKDVDGKELQVVQVMESKPDNTAFVVFIEK